MSAGGVPFVPAPAACCDLGRCDPHHPLPPTPYTYTDIFGFVYHLCEVHYRAVAGALLRHDGVLRRAQYAPPPEAPRRPHAEPTAAERAAAPAVSGTQAWACRLALGWSQRELARQLGVSRAQLAEAEAGRRPVDPRVARWVLEQHGGTLPEPDR